MCKQIILLRQKIKFNKSKLIVSVNKILKVSNQWFTRIYLRTELICSNNLVFIGTCSFISALKLLQKRFCSFA